METKIYTHNVRRTNGDVERRGGGYGLVLVLLLFILLFFKGTNLIVGRAKHSLLPHHILDELLSFYGFYLDEERTLPNGPQAD